MADKETQGRLIPDWKWKATAVVWSVVLKMLLIPAYRSTDFEVHRNWMAITSSLPMTEWYLDTTSEWTLDYPPAFAYFEFLLGKVAKFVDSGILDLTALNYASYGTILFQRLTVIVSGDLLLLVTTAAYGMDAEGYALVMLSPALMIVDNIHFQYNGFVIGVLLLAIRCIARQERWSFYCGALLFALTLSLKQTLLYCVPTVASFVLFKGFFRKAALWAFAFVGTMLALWMPFLHQLDALKSRLFPFGRGLLHSYWAPNLWAVLASLDVVLAMILGAEPSRATRGLIGLEEPFTVLPNVSPKFSLALCCIAMIPCLWFRPDSTRDLDSWPILLAAVGHAFLCAFMFGWHVHEKSLLLVLLPFGIVARQFPAWKLPYRILSVTGTVSMFPLLYEPGELLLKYSLLAMFSVFLVMKMDLGSNKIENMYYVGLLTAELYASFAHGLIFGKRLPFMPLMLVSCYCAVGISCSWLLSSRLLLREDLFSSRRTDSKDSSQRSKVD